MQSSSSTTTASNKKSSAEEKAPATAIKQISEIIINRYTKGRGSGRRTKKDPLYNHITIARCFPFIISPFISFKDVLNDGLDYGSLLIRSEDDEDAEAEFDILPEDVRTRVRDFGSLETTFPSLYLGEIFDELCAEENRGILNSFIEELGKISEATRSNDASDLKAQGQNYLRDNMLCDAIVPLGEKSTRGFHNRVTAQLLCPRSSRDEYHTDVNFIEKLEAREVDNMDAGHWPSFLYGDLPYDPTNKAVNLLRGPVVTRVFLHIMTGQLSATTNGRKVHRQCKIIQYKIQSVVPEMVAYAAVHCYLFLSDLEQWSYEDPPFSLEIFYKNIIRFLTVSRMGRETLAWYEALLPDGVLDGSSVGKRTCDPAAEGNADELDEIFAQECEEDRLAEEEDRAAQELEERQAIECTIEEPEEPMTALQSPGPPPIPRLSPMSPAPSSRQGTIPPEFDPSQDQLTQDPPRASGPPPAKKAKHNANSAPGPATTTTIVVTFVPKRSSKTKSQPSIGTRRSGRNR